MVVSGQLLSFTAIDCFSHQMFVCHITAPENLLVSQYHFVLYHFSPIWNTDDSMNLNLNEISFRFFDIWLLGANPWREQSALIMVKLYVEKSIEPETKDNIKIIIYPLIKLSTSYHNISVSFQNFSRCAAGNELRSFIKQL